MPWVQTLQILTAVAGIIFTINLITMILDAISQELLLV